MQEDAAGDPSLGMSSCEPNADFPHLTANSKVTTRREIEDPIMPDHGRSGIAIISQLSAVGRFLFVSHIIIVQGGGGRILFGSMRGGWLRLKLKKRGKMKLQTHSNHNDSYMLRACSPEARGAPILQTVSDLTAFFMYQGTRMEPGLATDVLSSFLSCFLS
ncbi:hypothetical protein BDW74DRAFT_94770 [Aspergillus multicolor]|uniref:uncharacterized protein n=1 Tax=Aspergillus multicolor TaxID=41759 RepID=UPI003CCDEDF9